MRGCGPRVSAARTALPYPHTVHWSSMLLARFLALLAPILWSLFPLTLHFLLIKTVFATLNLFGSLSALCRPTVYCYLNSSTCTALRPLVLSETSLNASTSAPQCAIRHNCPPTVALPHTNANVLHNASPAHPGRAANSATGISDCQAAVSYEIRGCLRDGASRVYPLCLLHER